jgi:hypothetical protein
LASDVKKYHHIRPDLKVENTVSEPRD